jgi:hypothetical protein
VAEAWKALHFTKFILKEVNSNTESLAYPSLFDQFLNMRPVRILTGKDRLML